MKVNELIGFLKLVNQDDEILIRLGDKDTELKSLDFDPVKHLVILGSHNYGVDDMELTFNNLLKYLSKNNKEK